MVVGRQPHGGQNEQKLLKPNGVHPQISLAPPQINAFDGRLSVPEKLIFVSSYGQYS